MRAFAARLILLSSCAACTPARPPHYVIESDLAGFRYRPAPEVPDIALPVHANPAVAHVATYVHEGAPPLVVPVRVTRHQHARGLTESVRAKLFTLSAYTLDVKKLAGEHVWRLRGERGDVWLLWVSGHQLIKIGAPEGAPMVPSGVAEAYLDRYPSDLDRKGSVKRRADSAGPPVESPSHKALRRRVGQPI